MAYDRFDTRRRSHGEQERWQGDRHHNRGRDERGFFERAGEEIASWFGDDDPSDRERSHRDHERDGRGRSSYGGSDRDRSERSNWFGPSSRGEQELHRGREQQRGARNVSDGHYRPDGDDRRGQRGYRPMTGDYGRSERFGASYREVDDRGGLVAGPRQPQSQWQEDDYRRTSFAGSRDRSQHHDPHYHQWRERQLNELDRDYDEYYRERQSRFEDDFGSWRERRQQKRQTLAQVREHMEVVGKDGEHVGTIERTAGDRIILTRSDPQAGGAHHSISCNDVDRVEDNRVLLDCTADEAKKRWRDEDRSRALFEREGQGEDGPHMLDRSFSGTYRD